MGVLDLSNLYVDLLERTLTGAITDDPGFAPALDPIIPLKYDEHVRSRGTDWPMRAATMIGLTRLRHLGKLIRQVMTDRVPGDLIETGVWRGGACIYMRAMLAVLGDADRRVWVADSFMGLPPPDPKYPADANYPFHAIKMLSVSLDEVKANFAKFNMLDNRVEFLKGWFKDTLPAAPIEKLAILRLDGDLYESTVNTLDALYTKYRPAVSLSSMITTPCRRANRPLPIFATGTVLKNRLSRSIRMAYSGASGRIGIDLMRRLSTRPRLQAFISGLIAPCFVTKNDRGSTGSRTLRSEFEVFNVRRKTHPIVFA